MNSFVHHVLTQLEQYAPLNGFVYVVPNRRSVSEVYRVLAEKNKRPIWAPECLTIDELFEQISGYALLSSTDQLFELHKIYNDSVPLKDRLSIKGFQNLGKLLLQDFNDIDLSLSPADKLFKELEQLIELDATFAPDQQSELMRSHLSRVKRIASVYRAFISYCDPHKKAYQGLVYRRAFEQVSSFASEQHAPFVFIGFNAFSRAEQEVVKTLLTEVEGSRIFWDIDWDLLQDDQHESGLFIRRYRSEWNFLERQRPFSVFKENNALFHKQREIEIIEAPGVLAQVHALNALLHDKESFEDMVVVLADESLLEAVMHTLNYDQTKGPINITMGNALTHTSTASLINYYIDLRLAIHDKKPYLSTALIKRFIEHPLQQGKLMTSFVQEFLTAARVKKTLLFGHHLFTETADLTEEWQRFVDFLGCIETPVSTLVLEQMKAHKHRVFEGGSDEFGLERLQVLFNELLSTQKITFKGDPKSGLQLMGILETRNLQFDTIVVLSLNEKILPKGRSFGSLLPYDLRRSYDIPTYKEKDAIYTYYFYRLLQGASKAHLLYNGQLEAFEGKEKSRLLYQMELEPRLEKQIIYRSVSFNQPIQMSEALIDNLSKSPEYLAALGSHLKKGVSVSSMLAYLHDPYTFYRRHLLQLKDHPPQSDRMEANVLGTLIHDALDLLYAEHTQCLITIDRLDAIEARVTSAIHLAYEKNGLSVTPENGRAILIYDVVNSYVGSVIQADRETINSGAALRILSLEDTYTLQLHGQTANSLKVDEIILKGKIDRIDEIDGVLRITDYKTGTVLPSEAAFNELEDCLEVKKQKVFQLLFYQYLLMNHVDYTHYFQTQRVQASIFSTKNRAHYYLNKDKHPFAGDREQLDAFGALLETVLVEMGTGQSLALRLED